MSCLRTSVHKVRGMTDNVGEKYNIISRLFRAQELPLLFGDVRRTAEDFLEDLKGLFKPCSFDVASSNAAIRNRYK